MRNLLVQVITLSVFVMICCKSQPDTPGNNKGTYITDTAHINGTPAWILQGNIYEVNVRQYTPEGTFNAFAKHLDRLKEMGVQTLWFMPIQPISKEDRKGKLGSYYAIADYTAVNPEFGSLDDWKLLVKTAHEKGFKVILDWVANHTGADHKWLVDHPDFYVLDSITGKAKYAFDWSDTRDLNYENPQMRDSMVAAMKFWLSTDIDGFRCDVAGEVPDDFWVNALSQLRQINPGIFTLAESNDAHLHQAGFNATYSWDEFSKMKKIAAGQANATLLDSAQANLANYPANALRLYFTSNHDENSWNKADYGTMPGDVHAPFAVLTQTWGRSLPLIYSGQEEPFLDSLSFFYKDTITFSKFNRAGFYKQLLNLRASNAALAANVPFTKVDVGSPEQLYAFVRKNGNNQVFVLLNLAAKTAVANITDAGLLNGATNQITNLSAPVAGTKVTLPAWGYAVFVK